MGNIHQNSLVKNAIIDTSYLTYKNIKQSNEQIY